MRSEKLRHEPQSMVSGAKPCTSVKVRSSIHPFIAVAFSTGKNFVIMTVSSFFLEFFLGRSASIVITSQHDLDLIFGTGLVSTVTFSLFH